VPEQKLRIVQALKRNGDIVAMTGDGVNDAPSLKAAHIGIAMGGRGTDVAREAASIVLLDDDFGSIVTAIRLGRRIYDNLRKAVGFIFAVHVPIAGMALLPLVLGLPIFFSPIHIAFLEMVIDPVCSLVFEAETDERDLMGRPPRAPDSPLFSWPLIAWSVLQGALAFAVVALVYVTALYRGMPDTEARALGFFSLILVIFSLVLVQRVAGLRRPPPERSTRMDAARHRDDTGSGSTLASRGVRIPLRTAFMVTICSSPSPRPRQYCWAWKPSSRSGARH